MTKNVEDIRNIAVVGHGSAGKTTLVDHLLVRTGAVSGHPSVDDGTSICDFDEEEKHHKHSIEAAVANFEHRGKHFNIIDCPGYPELIGQTIGALRAVDNALIAIDAHAGIKVNTRRAWKEAVAAGIGKIIVVTKMDADNIDFDGLMADIQEAFGNNCVPVNLPVGLSADFQGVVSTVQVPDDTSGALGDPNSISEALIESIIEVDEAMMEKYFEGELPTSDQLAALMIRAIASGSLVPILFVSTAKEIGIDELLDFLATSAVPPNAIQRTTQDGKELNSRPVGAGRCPGVPDQD